MKFKLRIPVAYQSRSAQNKAAVGGRPDQIVECEVFASCKSDLGRKGSAQDRVRQIIEAQVLPGDKRPIACLSYLPGCIVEQAQ